MLSVLFSKYRTKSFFRRTESGTDRFIKTAQENTDSDSYKRQNTTDKYIQENTRREIGKSNLGSFLVKLLH